tara:strand:- start:262 stop:879 length:618 start_codon:yes stop_codon:yes gene_type:complete
MKVGIINYGIGNVSAFKYAFKKLNCEAYIVDKPEQISDSTHLILPGVGSFDYAMDLIHKSGLISSISEGVLIKKKPILGVCVGMQIIFEKSEEGEKEGFGWIKGKVKKFKFSNAEKIKIPHMGWNTIKNIESENKLCKKLNGHEFYFLHSYYCVPKNKDLIISTTEYGAEICAVVQQNNISGCQFHPEKSHDSGLKVLSNFLEID